MIKYLHHQYDIEFIFKGSKSKTFDSNNPFLKFLTEDKSKIISQAYHFFEQNNLLGEDLGQYLPPNHIAVSEKEVFHSHQRPLGNRPIIILDQKFTKSVLLHEFIHHLKFLDRNKSEFNLGRDSNQKTNVQILAHAYMQEALSELNIDSSEYIDLMLQMDLLEHELYREKNLEELLVNHILIEHSNILNFDANEIGLLHVIHSKNLVNYSTFSQKKAHELNTKYSSLNRSDYGFKLTHLYEIDLAIIKNEILWFAQATGQSDKIIKWPQ